MRKTSGRKTFLDIFPPPDFLLISNSGIVLTDAHTRFVELKRDVSGRGFRISRSEKIDNPEGAIVSGVVSDEAKLVSVLKPLAAKSGARYARVALPDEKTYIFTTSIDEVAPENLRDAAAFIIEEYVPISVADAVFDFEVVGRSKAKKKINIAVSVAPKSLVESYTKAFEASGITPISFDIESQAIARAVIPHYDERAHLIINLSKHKAGLYVAEDGVVQFSTNISYGQESDISDVEGEMKKVIDFWNGRSENYGRGNGQIEKIVVCGAGADESGFSSRLLERFDVESALADENVNISGSDAKSGKIKNKDSSDYVAAIGLILHRENKKYV